MKATWILILCVLAPYLAVSQVDSINVWRQELELLRSKNQYKAAWVYAELIERYLLAIDPADWRAYKKDFYLISELADRVGESQKCISCAERGLRLFEPEDTSLLAIEMRYVISRCYESNSQNDRALEALQQCIALVKKHHPTRYDKLVAVSTSLIRYLFMAGQYAQAEKLIDELRALYNGRLVKKDCSYAHFLRGLANHYFNISDYQQAAALLREGMTVCDESSNPFSYHLTASLLASVLVQQGDLLTADKLLSAALPVLRERVGETGDMYVYAVTTRLTLLNDMGLFEQVVGEADYMQQVLEKAGLEHSYNYVFILRVKGYALLQLKEQEKGFELLEKGYQLAKAHIPEGNVNLYYAINNLAFAYAEEHLYNKAEALIPEMTRVAGVLDLSVEATFLDLMYLLALGKQDYNQAVAIQKQKEGQNADGLFYCRSQIRLANLYLELNKIDSTLHHLLAYRREYNRIYSTLLAILRENERLQFLEFNRQYAGVLFRAAQLSDNPQIYYELLAEFSLRNKALLLRSQHRLKQAIEDKKDPTLLALFNQWVDIQQLRSRVESMGVDAASQAGYQVGEIQRMADSIYLALHRNQSLESLRAIFTPEVNRQQIVQTLRPNEAAVDITRFEIGFTREKQIGYAVQVFKTTVSQPITIFISDPVGLETFVAEWYKTAVHQADAHHLPQGLYKAIWEPIDRHLQGINRVYLVADGVYHQFPIEDLPHPLSGQVIDHTQIVRLLNLSELVEPIQVRPQNKAVLIGSPDYNLHRDASKPLDTIGDRRSLPGLLAGGIPNLTPLPGSLREINRLSDLFTRHEYHVDVYTGSAASELVLANRQASGCMYHIATHGYHAPPRGSKKGPGNPLLRTMLFFAGARQTLEQQSSDLTDGVLTAFECSTLPMHQAYLVCISACYSGAAYWLTGEGAFGLPRAFHMAGAAHTLVSMWEVDDEIDQELLHDFYSRLLSGVEIHEALYQAKLHHRTKYPAPKYWAGWMLTGR